MPKPRLVLNGFTAFQVHKISGLSVHMVNYLAREGYLRPSYGQGHRRGKVRYYSFRDLVVTRIVGQLLSAGIELKRLKRAIKLLSLERTWLVPGNEEHAVSLLATDGKSLFFPDKNGSLIELTNGGQRAFAFVLDVEKAESHVMKHLHRDQRKVFDMRNRELLPWVKQGDRSRAIRKANP